MSTNNPQVSEDAEAELGSIQGDVVDSPESAWLFAWIKSGGLYLTALIAYLAAVVGLVAIWNRFVATEGEAPNTATYIMACIVAMPLLLAFLLNVVPALRRRRELRLWPKAAGGMDTTYFQTSPRTDDSHGFFAHGYEGFVSWARNATDPLLHLAGLSGSGKSSLIEACLSPRLAVPDSDGSTTRTVVVRTSSDPLENLKEKLLRFWAKKPEDYASLSALEALHRAVRKSKGERILVVFDQFEEFFLLDPSNRDVKTDRESEAKGSVSGNCRINRLREFLHDLLAAPPERVAVLLSYREDHRRLLRPLELPPLEERRNWMSVDPFDFAAATAFLRGCPGLSIPQARMDRVLREAARQESGRVVNETYCCESTRCHSAPHGGPSRVMATH